MSSSIQIVPVSSLFPAWTARRVNDNCRAGRVPGAFKVGAAWVISEADAARMGTVRGALTVEDAAADLRARGVL